MIEIAVELNLYLGDIKKMNMLWKIIVLIVIIILCHIINYYFYFNDFENRKLYCIIGDVILAVGGLLAIFLWF